MYCLHVKHLRQLTTGSVSRYAEQQGVFTYIIVQAELYQSMLKRSIAFFFFFFFFFYFGGNTCHVKNNTFKGNNINKFTSRLTVSYS